MAVAVPAHRPVQAVFDRMSLTEIGALFKYNLDGTINWCRQYGLLAHEMDCPTCNSDCREQNYARSVDGKIWRCSNKLCKKTISIRKGSFFEQSHLQLWQVIGITYCWCIGCGKGRAFSHNILKNEMEISSPNTIVDWNQFCRDIAVAYFRNHPQQLGGPGVVVEIDESLFARRKNNVGRVVPEQWVFGGYEPATKQGFLVPVPARDAATLLPIIRQWIAPGSVIWSDMWAAYNQIGNIGYQHGTVNHTLNFVDPLTQVTTNRVEAMWQRAKSKFKAMHGPTNRDMIEDHLAEFMWSQRFSNAPFYSFWHQIANEMYVVA